MDRILNPVLVFSRVFLALLFLMAGASMIDQYAVAHVYVIAMGLPGPVLPMIIAIVVVSALALMTGFKVRWAAVMLAGLSLASALLLHVDFGDPSQAILFIRNLLIGGVLLVVAAADADRESVPQARQEYKSSEDTAPSGCCHAGC